MMWPCVMAMSHGTAVVLLWPLAERTDEGQEVEGQRMQPIGRSGSATRAALLDSANPAA